MRLLLAEDSVAPNDEETYASLLSKHSRRLELPNSAAGYISIELAEDCLKSFPPGSQGGRDGLRSQHLKDMFFSPPDLNTQNLIFQTLQDFTNLIFKGHFPGDIKSLFFGARLIAPRKKD